MNRATRAAVSLVLLVTAVSGCGYSLRGHLPSHIRTIAVPIFVNRTRSRRGQLDHGAWGGVLTNGSLRLAKLEDADALL